MKINRIKKVAKCTILGLAAGPFGALGGFAVGVASCLGILGDKVQTSDDYDSEY